MHTAPAAHFLTGVIEGFYGDPWPHNARMRYAHWLATLHLDCYLYAPKSDPYLRKRWREHWPAKQWRLLHELARCYRGADVALGLGLSPFQLYADYGAASRRALRDKINRLNELDAPLLAILFDDMPGDQADLAARQAEIVHDVLDGTTAGRVLVCPTYYSLDPVLERVFGPRPASYWEQLGALLPAQVDLFWTGDRVCAERIAGSDLDAISNSFQRPVTLWDNYPVNDGAQRSQHLYLAAPPARDAALAGHARGHLCNGMNQPWLTLPALAGLAAMYGRIADSTAWLRATLGAAATDQLQRDAGLLRDCALSELAPAERQRLQQCYQAMDSPAAREICAWLDGRYAFDPACLTD